MRQRPIYRRSMRYAVFLLAALLLFVGCSSSTTRPIRPPTATGTRNLTGPSQDWLTFGYDAARSGVNPNERILSPGNVAGLHRLWQVRLPDVEDSPPVLLSGLTLPDGSVRDVLYVLTRDGQFLALDVASGALLWSHHPTGPKITHSSPVADSSRQYVYAYGLDGALHKYAATTGDEVTGGGWPASITRMTSSEKESSAPNLANGRIYVVTSGYLGDAPPYQGHVVSIALADGSEHIFNSLCANLPYLLGPTDCASQQSGIWARGGAIVDSITGNLFVVTGNGTYTGNAGGNNWGDSVLELSSDGSRLLDSYTPATYQQLDETDADLGSTAPAMLPTIPNSRTPYLLVQGGKDGILRLLNRRDLSSAGGLGHIGGELQTLATSICGLFTQPVVWHDLASGAVFVFVAAQCGFTAYRLDTDASGVSRLRQVWTADLRATTPILAGGVLFAETSGAIVALDPSTGHTLWTSDQASADGSIGGIHWQSPIVAGGRLYCADESGHLTAYGL